MLAFFSKYSFIIIWILVIAAVGAAFIFIVQPDLHLLFGEQSTPTPVSGSGSSGTAAAPTPANPSVNLFIEKTKNGGTLFVQWANLPGNTTALNIFRGSKNSTSGWSLWKSLQIGLGALGNGSSSINLKSNELGYSYFIEAVNGSGNATSSTGSGNGSNGPTVLWTSSVSLPDVVTSTPPGGPSGNGNNNGNNGNSNNNQTSTPPGNTPPPSPAPAPAPSPSPSPSAEPTGIPYYSPNLQNTEYGNAQTGNFWVQHVDNKIQIGWQNLPPNVTNVVILRSPNQDGPWSIVLTQQNPSVNGSYSIEVIDDTLGQPYFYEMNAAVGSSTVATYGPTYLPSN